jgi:hypothetical protein
MCWIGLCRQLSVDHPHMAGQGKRREGKRSQEGNPHLFPYPIMPESHWFCPRSVRNLYLVLSRQAECYRLERVTGYILAFKCTF